MNELQSKELSVGERIRYYRKRRGLTQSALAGQVGRSENWLYRVERGEIPVDRLSVLLGMCRVLGVHELSDLTGPAVDTGALGGSEHPAVPAIRRALTAVPSRLATAREGQPLGVDELVGQVRQAWRVYETERQRYAPVGEMLPGLLAEAHATVRSAPAGEESRALHALVSLYHLLQVYLRRIGERTLSRVAADRALQLADDTGDPVLIAASAWNMCSVLTSSGDVEDSLDLARSAIAACEPGEEATSGHLSAYGALHLAAAIAAVRADQAPAAWDLLRTADAVAARLGGDRNDWHTSFGPTNVGMHGVHLAAEEGDVTEALRLADGVEVNPALPLERRTRYLVEVMNSNRLNRDDYATIYMLNQIKESSPEEISYFPLARDAVSDLLKRERPAWRADVRGLASHMGLIA